MKKIVRVPDCFIEVFYDRWGRFTTDHEPLSWKDYLPFCMTEGAAQKPIAIFKIYLKK